MDHPLLSELDQETIATLRADNVRLRALIAAGTMYVLTETYGEHCFKVVGVADLSKQGVVQEWRRADPAHRDVWEVEVYS